MGLFHSRKSEAATAVLEDAALAIRADLRDAVRELTVAAAEQRASARHLQEVAQTRQGLRDC